ncbi:MAG: NAD(P)/FAD-dependent oxidoreductase [Syntrophaceae bacterium]
MKIVVIGAGAAGLAATHALRKAGVDVTTFEAGPYAGGRARCYQKDGFIFDTGAQFMAKVCATQLRLCHELGLSDEIFNFDLKTSHWRDGKIHPLPTAGNIRKFLKEIPELFKFRGLPLAVYPQMARLAFHLIKRYINVDITKMNPECLLDLGDMSVADFTLKYGGKEALDWVMAPMVAGLTLGEAEEVSIPHIIGLMGLYEGLLLLQRGIGSLPDALYEICKDSIRLNTPIKKVVIENHAVRGVETQEGFIPADHVICATTASMARKLMPDLPDGMRKPLETVRYSQTVHVMLALKNRLLPGGIYILTLPRPAQSFMPALNDCSEKSSYFAPPGTGLSHCVTYGRRAQELQSLSDGEIVDKVIEEVRRFVPLASQDIIMTEVVRWNEAICLESPGEFPAMYCLKRNHLHDVKGLHLAGEYMYLVSCVEGALRSGEDAAAAILAGG